MKVVAFLQNMYVRPDQLERVKKSIEQVGEELRRRYIEYSLFAGCLTGRRLKAVFGENVCQKIHWEETTREIAGDAKTIFPAQPEHIRAVIKEQKPDVILTFGAIAAKAVRAQLDGSYPESLDVTFISAPHPAARQPDTLEKLKAAAEQLKQTLPNWFKS